MSPLNIFPGPDTGGVVAHDWKQRTSGNITLNSTTWANVDTGLDITFAAAAGDWVEVGLAGYVNTATVDNFFDAQSIVAGSPVNSWAIDSGVPGASDQGVPCWRMERDRLEAISGSVIRQLVAGDISGGSVLIRLRYRSSSATNRTLNATAALPLIFWARNLSAGPAVVPVVLHARNDRTAGTLTLNSTTWADVDTGLDITLAGASGDWVEVGVSCVTENEAVEMFLDAVSVVSGSPVNSWGRNTAPDNSHAGIEAWRSRSGTRSEPGGTMIRQLAAGDISGGNVTLRLRYRTGAASNKTLYATTNNTLTFWARNHRG